MAQTNEGAGAPVTAQAGSERPAIVAASIVEGQSGGAVSDDANIERDLDGGSSEPTGKGRATGPDKVPAVAERNDDDDDEVEGEDFVAKAESAEGDAAPGEAQAAVGFDQAAFDARMAELDGQAAAQTATGAQDGARAPQGGLTPELEALLTPLDPSLAKYESEVPLYETINGLQQVVKDLLTSNTQVQQMQVRQVAEGVAREMQSGAKMIEDAYGIRVNPDQMGALLRRNVDLARAAGGFTAEVCLEAFERENWKSLMLAGRVKEGPAATPSPKTLRTSDGGGGLGRMPRHEQRLTEDELIMRDLVG